MNGLREHRVTLLKNEWGQVIRARCEDCGADLMTPQDHHEPEHCLLVSQGFDPESFVRRASSRLPKHDPTYGSHPSQGLPVKAVPTLAGEA